MRYIKLFFLFTIAPLLGMLLALVWNYDKIACTDCRPLLVDISTSQTYSENLLGTFDNFKTAKGSLDSSLQEEEALYQEQQQLLKELSQKSQAQQLRSEKVYEEMILSRLGDPIREFKSDNVEIFIFEMKKEDLRGYMAKIRLKKPKSLEIALSPEEKKTGETTSAAVKRLGGVFGVNGGGFAKSTKDGTTRLVPLGNTMIEGKLVGDFIPSYNDLSFAGFTKEAKLVGGVYDKEEELKKSGAWQGVSFVPVLIKNWQPVEIPKKWARQRQPRTVLGQYPNGDLFFIVVDGRRSNWSRGISLEEMQVTLMRLGVMEAFNLDGGGSSSFVFQGKVLNKPSDGKERAISTNIVVLP
ncbi:MAG TPA: phosphodiester glycosidase family protein [Negativicutes bacterium]|nr:phosphodiester glycosidase family protein [Negativicutes bacterium]